MAKGWRIEEVDSFAPLLKQTAVNRSNDKAIKRSVLYVSLSEEEKGVGAFVLLENKHTGDDVLLGFHFVHSVESKTELRDDEMQAAWGRFAGAWQEPNPTTGVLEDKHSHWHGLFTGRKGEGMLRMRGQRRRR